MTIVETDVENPAAQRLMAQLDALIEERYPGEPPHRLDPEDFRSSAGVLLMATVEGAAVACGAFQPRDGETAVMKRVFVDPAHRGRGYARGLVAALEGRARRRGFRTMYLETGDLQPEAIALYESMGYKRVACRDEYESGYPTVCFEKSLDHGEAC